MKRQFRFLILCFCVPYCTFCVESTTAQKWRKAESSSSHTHNFVKIPGAFKFHTELLLLHSFTFYDLFIVQHLFSASFHMYKVGHISTLSLYVGARNLIESCSAPVIPRISSIHSTPMQHHLSGLTSYSIY